MIQNITNYLFIQHNIQTLLISISFYLSVLTLINAETIMAASKRATKSFTVI
jgi:hypothetical protein